MQGNSSTKKKITQLFNEPLLELVFKAQTIHRKNHKPNTIQLATLLSIKTGGCPEDCSYCSQSGHHDADLEKEKLLPLDVILGNAKLAKAKGATRFCLGGAWRTPPAKAMPTLCETIKQIKELGLETCATFGNLDESQVDSLQKSGLDYYNHNIDTSPEHYCNIVTTHSFQDRIDTINRVRNAGIKVCCGGILGMGETREDRISFLTSLAEMDPAPESVPINQLIPIKGTPLEDAPMIPNFEFIRTIAVARIIMPKSVVRLSAGRTNMSQEMQALCFLAGANSIFYGDKLLTADNPEANQDSALFAELALEVSC